MKHCRHTRKEVETMGGRTFIWFSSMCRNLRHRLHVRRYLALPLVVFLVVGVAYARSYEVTKKAGAFETAVRIDRNPPIVGDNRIEIEIRDQDGKSITDASVLVNYYMPPMPRMAPMNYITDAKLTGDTYKATMNFIMSGPWIIAVKIDHDGKRSTAKFNVDAQ
jgi:YtkA-like